MQVFLSVAPRDAREALSYHNRLAHMGYRIGGESRLLRQGDGRIRGGLLSISDRDCPPIARPEELCRETVRECVQRMCGGVAADFEGGVTADRIRFLRRLSALLGGGGRTLYLPERYAPHVPDAVALIGTAMSGGDFRQRLTEAAERFGAERLALDVERLAMDFPLPAPDGVGDPLTAEALRTLLAEQQPNQFYSRELCARYFTYNCRGSVRFVLFDDGDTIRRKLRIGRDLGVRTAFLLYPEVKDLLPGVLNL